MPLIALPLFAPACKPGADTSGNSPLEHTTARQQDLSPTARSTNDPSRILEGITARPATDQTEDKTDRDTTLRIRQALHQDSRLTPIANQIKVITVNGKVTLRGQVFSQEDIAAALQAAQKVSGTNVIDNQLELKTANH